MEITKKTSSPFQYSERTIASTETNDTSAKLTWSKLSFKKGGKIQTGLNCEVDSLSKACLWLAYSRGFFRKSQKFDFHQI